MKPLSFLLDTDWVIDHFNAVSHVTQRLKELEPQGLGLSVISAAELWEGVYFSRDPKRSQAMLAYAGENSGRSYAVLALAMGLVLPYFASNSRSARVQSSSSLPGAPVRSR